MAGWTITKIACSSLRNIISLWYMSFLPGVQKQVSKKTKKKRVVIVLLVVAVLLAVGGAMFFLRQENKADTARTKAAEKVVSQFQREGDSDLETAFIAEIKDKDLRGAQAVFEKPVKRANGDAKKQLLTQYYNLSLEYGVKDGAVAAATKLDDIEKTHESAFRVAKAYHAKDDMTQYKAHINDALERAKQLEASETKDFLVQMYTEMAQDESKRYDE